jgi:hypothetical protein
VEIVFTSSRALAKMHPTRCGMMTSPDTVRHVTDVPDAFCASGNVHAATNPLMLLQTSNLVVSPLHCLFLRVIKFGSGLHTPQKFSRIDCRASSAPSLSFSIRIPADHTIRVQTTPFKSDNGARQKCGD